MIKPINFITFKSHRKTYYDGKNKVVEFYTDSNEILSRNEYDEFDRHIHTNWFDELGNDAGFMHKKYTEDGYIETCKTPSLDYTRIIRKFTKNGQKHRTEEYISNTHPESNYVNEDIRDMFGKLVRIISNGKIILDKSKEQI